jgi:pectinesterase inhibitor-like protein
MKSFLFCFFLLQLTFCSHFLHVFATPSKLVEEVCSKLVRIDKSVTPNVCHFFFQHDPQSRTAVDYHALGLIAVNVTTKVAMETVTIMNRTKVDNQIDMVSCMDSYDTGITLLKVAAKSLKIKNYILANYTLIYVENIVCFKSFFTKAAHVLVAMVQLLVNTYGAY